MIKRNIATLLVIFCFLFFLTSCKTQQDNPGNTSDNTQKTDILSENKSNSTQKTNILYKNTSDRTPKTEILDENKFSFKKIIMEGYSVFIPKEWEVKQQIGDMIEFKIKDKIIGGVNVLAYNESDKMGNFTRNHSETLENEKLSDFFTDVFFLKLKCTQPAAANDPSVNIELHYYFIIPDKKVTYDLFFDASDVSKDLSFQIAKGFSCNNKEVIQNNSTKVIQLTETELDYFNGDLFFNGKYFNIRNQFLSSTYDKPADINLFKLFYCGSQEKITDDELMIVAKKNKMSDNIDNIPCPCDKNSSSYMNKILMENMGITVDDTNKKGLEKFVYLPQYDAYYNFHGDTNYRSKISFSKGEREGDIVRLYYDDKFMCDGYKVLTLKKNNQGYQFISNQRANS